MSVTKTGGIAVPQPTPVAINRVVAAWRDGEPIRARLERGAHMVRVVRAQNGAAEAAKFATELFASPADSRFTPIRDRSGAVLPAGYAAAELPTALWEVVLRDVRHRGLLRIPAADTRHRFAVDVEITLPLEVIDLRRPCDVLLARGKGRSPALIAAPQHLYPTTRRWAQHLLDAIPEAQGLLYESYQVPGWNAVLVARDGQRQVFTAIGAARPVWKGSERQMLIDEAAKAGAAVDFYEPLLQGE